MTLSLKLEISSCLPCSMYCQLTFSFNDYDRFLSLATLSGNEMSCKTSWWVEKHYLTCLKRHLPVQTPCRLISQKLSRYFRRRLFFGQLVLGLLCRTSAPLQLSVRATEAAASSKQQQQHQARPATTLTPYLPTPQPLQQDPSCTKETLKWCLTLVCPASSRPSHSLVEVDRLDRLMAASVEKCSNADERPLSLHSSTMFPSQSNVKMSLDECSINMYKGATLFMTQFLHQLTV